MGSQRVGHNWATFTSLHFADSSVVKNPPTHAGDSGFMDQKNPVEKEMATQSSILAWRIPWTEEPDRLQSMCVCSVSQLCLTLCNLMDWSPKGSSVLEIFQAKVLEWLLFPSPGDLPDPGNKLLSLASPVLAGRFFTTALPPWGHKKSQTQQLHNKKY